MTDFCIVCEAFFQSCLENLLCDDCREPAEIPLQKESAMDEGVEDSLLHVTEIMKFQNAKNRISRVKRKLIF